MKLPIRLLVRLDHLLIFRLFYTIGIKIDKDLKEVGYHISSAVDTKFCLSGHVNLWISYMKFIIMRYYNIVEFLLL